MTPKTESPPRRIFHAGPLPFAQDAITRDVLSSSARASLIISAISNLLVPRSTRADAEKAFEFLRE